MRARNVLIVAESFAGAVPQSVGELLTVAASLVRQGGGEVAATLLGEAGPETAQALAARGVRRVLHAPITDRANVTAEAHLPALVEACARVSPSVVLLTHDLLAAEIAPRLAFRLGGAAATGCVDVAVDAGTARCTRPCYGGLAREVIEYSRSPLVATVRPGLFEPAPAEPRSEASVEVLDGITPEDSRTRILAREAEPIAGIRLEDARVIVAGGRGLEGPEGFTVLQALADELGAAVGSSRVPCDLGWCPHSWQIGLTGKTVTPELYVAVGISGAGHHMAGCGNAKTIVAINTDPEAAIFQDARFGIVGDYRDIVPALVAEIHKLKQAG